MKHRNETQILALDVRHSRMGYTLFSGPKRLLDWGICTVPSRCNDRIEWMRGRATAIMRNCSPASIVVKQQRTLRLSRNSTGEPILKAILSAAEKRGIPVHFLGRDEIHTAFRVFQVRTKDDIACVLVRIFPELLIRLPPKRKKWQSEPHRMILFDAIATGFAYWHRFSPRE